MRYELKRLGQGIFTYVFAMTIMFLLFRFKPGSQRESDIIDWGEPLAVAYVDYLATVLIRFDLGVSYQYAVPVFDFLFEALPWTLFVSLFGLLLGFSFNIFWGTALAYKEGSHFDRFGSLFALLGISIPFFVASIVALAYLSYSWHLLPKSGLYPQYMTLELPYFGEVASWERIQPGFNSGFLIGVVWHGALMIFSGFVLVLSGLGMRGNAIRVMESDYIQVARLRGLSGSRIAQRYVARNAVLPTYTGLMIGIPSIFSATLVTERIFRYHAVGYYTSEALGGDTNLLMGSFMFLTGVSVIGILVADLSYKYIDPRAGDGNGEAF